MGDNTAGKCIQKLQAQYTGSCNEAVLCSHNLVQDPSYAVLITGCAPRQLGLHIIVIDICTPEAYALYYPVKQQISHSSFAQLLLRKEKVESLLSVTTSTKLEDGDNWSFVPSPSLSPNTWLPTMSTSQESETQFCHSRCAFDNPWQYFLETEHALKVDCMRNTMFCLLTNSG